MQRRCCPCGGTTATRCRRKTHRYMLADGNPSCWTTPCRAKRISLDVFPHIACSFLNFGCKLLCISLSFFHGCNDLLTDFVQKCASAEFDARCDCQNVA